ncbi:putative lipoprotein [Borreliella burgdorferi 29805]|uniref:SIMPL domain-containing protein n=2 Tax=Borreliella burgdorferi TaxID=139 RepID=UPI000199A517|nr:SIMPL domain-containing protein [Borreliella burgdorferi]EEH32139.1 putative lipoprotein [Borreliella burgdorferi 29805]MCD2309228.1 SIMPL domain-containing protein [Borreliella burgdorferi]MCD2318212.1 SIMPL domain-containing protein [Borreliella burgdorferi]MCD2376647.1 SIMPL domain-containing protein [Borreliella burgdorferi]MCD2377456.1 SIMPL domain-containing protein [Borreliella burgdorferi]
MYIALIANTIDIEKMKTVEKNIIEFYNQGLPISSNRDLRYYLNRINDTNFQILAGSIRNAELSALEFTRHFGSKLDKIKNANQEYFKFFLVDIIFGNPKLYPKEILRIASAIYYYLD